MGSVESDSEKRLGRRRRRRLGSASRIKWTYYRRAPDGAVRHGDLASGELRLVVISALSPVPRCDGQRKGRGRAGSWKNANCTPDQNPFY
jgi:hypothetical protein